MLTNVYLWIFSVAFLGCVLTTPLVTRLASRVGAIDRPDKFRRIHQGAIPRLGGLALAAGLVVGLLPVVAGGYLRDWSWFPDWWSKQGAVLVAGAIVLALGALDDTRGLGARTKLLGQTLAVLVLWAGGIRIERMVILTVPLPLSYPLALHLGGLTAWIDPLSLAVTLLWFLGCMNVWNLIDGMDGLASGVGLLVAGTMMLVAIHRDNIGSAVTSAALAGSLAGFLLYNWHPACIFLGDSGSLLIGLLLGVIGVQGSLKGSTAVSILVPILAMGLPISDTALAIFRRWVRDLPLTSADRRHIHHILIGLGLNPRQAALLLYCFSGFLCGVVLLGVAWNNEFMALVLGVSGCLAYLLILTSRRDELASLWADFRERLARGRQERRAAEVTWGAIQRIELCEGPIQVWEIMRQAAEALGGDHLVMACRHGSRPLVEFATEAAGADAVVSGPSASFRLSSGPDLELNVVLRQAAGAALAADIAFRALQRLALAAAHRLERLLAADGKHPAGPLAGDPTLAGPHPTPEAALTLPRAGDDRDPLGWPRGALGWDGSAAPRTWYGDD